MALQQCVLSEKQVTEGFLAAPPYIAQQIMDLTVKHPSWTRDLPKITEFPRGNGTQYQQIVFRGEMPQIERGFAQWKRLNNNTGCDPCSPDCSYNTTQFGGTGLERKLTELMYRDFVSPSYCIREIQTTANFEQVMAKIIENLYAQTDFFKDQNVCFNALTELAKKFVVDSTGARPNPQNPYVYRPAGTARVSALTIDILEFFYEYMRRIPDCIPYDVVNGAPIFSLIASQQTIARLYRDDPQLRQDVRFSGLANDMLMKYNFMSTIRGMFICAPILFPRRFNKDAVTGVWTEVLPYIKGIPMEVGSFTGVNPLYMQATHEEVLLHGKFPFEILYMPTETTLGNNTSFGPEFSWFNNWSWINPLTNTDYFRREGFFATSATIGIAPQFSDGIFGIIVERPQDAIMAGWLPAPSCPVEPPDCDNTVPDVLCPCPLILGYSADPYTADTYNLTLAVPISTTEGAEILFGLKTGGYILGTVVQVSSDGLTVQVTFAEGTDFGCGDPFTSIFCDDTLGCFADVVVGGYMVNCTDSTRLDLTLSNPIRADVGETITIYYGNGTSASVTVVSQDMLNNTITVDVGGTAFCDNVGGVLSLCVPTSTDSTCPGCDGAVITQCTT